MPGFAKVEQSISECEVSCRRIPPDVTAGNGDRPVSFHQDAQDCRGVLVRSGFDR